MSQLDPPSQPSTHSDRPKPLGEYLIEAKLLTPAHIEVALYDQQERGYRLGDILAMRGWVKEEIIEWVVQNKLLPERQVQEEDFDTLLISLKEVLEQQEGQKESEVSQVAESLEVVNEAEEAKPANVPEPWQAIPPPPPRHRSSVPKVNPSFLEVAERETLIIEGD
ncbi:MAG: hypothetical protein ACO3EZ_12260 [Prochlorotrichaceae cyanobacterium]